MYILLARDLQKNWRTRLENTKNLSSFDPEVAVRTEPVSLVDHDKHHSAIQPST